MKVRAAAVLVAALLAGCAQEAPPAWSDQDVAAAEAHVRQLLGFTKGGNPARYDQLADLRPAPGAIDGKPVQCARFADPASIGRRPGRNRVLVIGGDMIADAPSHERHFRVLWGVAGC